MQREYDVITAHNLWMQYREWTGKDVGKPCSFAAGILDSDLMQYYSKAPIQTQQRTRFYAMLCNQLERSGIKAKFDMRVVKYYEDLERGVEGVVTDDGQKFEADLVIAADGLSSKSQELIPAPAKKAKATGRTVFRAAFPLEIAAANPPVNATFRLKDGRHPFHQV